MGGGVKSPQGADTLGVAKVPRGDETRVGTTSTEGGPREDRRGRGGDEKPPTARSTRMQGENRGKGGPMDGPQTVEPPGTQQDMAADDDSVGTLPRKSEGANSARSKNGMHPCREYDLLASEATEGGQANTGAAGSEASHWATEEQ